MSSIEPKRRKLRPREPVSAMPSFVSQLTSLPLLGIDDRRYRELLVDHPEVPRTRIGKLVLVELDAMRELLRRLAVEAPSGNAEAEPAGEDDDDRRLDSPDAVLAAIGRRRAS